MEARNISSADLYRSNQILDDGPNAKAEADAVTNFLKVINTVIRGNGKPMSERTALKFLVSRKFDLERALELYQMHEITRLREGLTSIDPTDEDLKSELASGKFTIFKPRDPHQSAIAVYTAKLHAPTKSSKNQSLKRKVHKTTLQGIVYQLDSALEDILTQRYGLLFIYNMSDSDYSNFDYDLCQKILNLLKGAYPAKLKKVLIVSPPLWFRAPFHLLRLIVREKLRDRVSLVNVEQLSDHIPREALTPELGGTYHHDHQAWVAHCNTLNSLKLNDLCDLVSAENLVKSLGRKSSLGFRRPSHEALVFIEEANLNDGTDRYRNGHDRDNNTHDYDEHGMSVIQFVEYMRAAGQVGLGNEYDTILKNESQRSLGTFLVSSSQQNMKKNRYFNVKCFDHSRVVLEPYDLPDDVSPEDPRDYINANFVDGYRQPRAYVSTQGPIEQTIEDFWRMIWQTGSRVIVMVTLNIENQNLKCDKYWPSPDDRNMTLGLYKVEYISTELHEDFVATKLRLTNTRSEVSREIWHLQYISWPDFGLPSTSDALLRYREFALKKQLDAIEMSGSCNYPPVVVHCSAGVGRSGTFVTIDICIQKLETTGLVDVRSIVEKLREQRYLSIQTRDQYVFCYKSVVEYAVSCGLLSGPDVSDLL